MSFIDIWFVEIIYAIDIEPPLFIADTWLA